MVHIREIEAQLKNLGITVKFWGAPEYRELPNIIMPGEQIVSLVNGRYEGGFATLVATDHRLLLIDKKPLYLTTHDIRFEMISEVDFSARLLDTTITVRTLNKDLVFTSIRQNRLRVIVSYLQQRVMEMRMQQQYQPQAVQQYQNQLQQYGQPVYYQPEQAKEVPLMMTAPPISPINPYAKSAFTVKRYAIPYTRPR